MDLLTSDAVRGHKVTFIPEEPETTEFTSLYICALAQQIVTERFSLLMYLCLI